MEIEREAAIELLLDGFFPTMQRSPIGRARQRASGFQEIGLPFESDTGITRHLAAFLAVARRRRPRPHGRRTCCSTAACSRPPGCERVLEVLGDWFGAAKSAVGESKTRESRHNRSQAVRNAWPASTTSITPSPAARPTTAGPSSAAACGSAAARRGRTTWASNGRPGDSRRSAAAAGPVRRAVRHGRRNRDRRAVGRDRPGRRRARALSLLQLADTQRGQAGRSAAVVDDEELAETDSLEATLAGRRDDSRRTTCPCGFSSKITELGVFELWCVARRATSAGSWSSACERTQTEELNAEARDADDESLEARNPESHDFLFVSAFLRIIVIVVMTNAPSNDSCAEPLRRRHRSGHDQLGRGVRRYARAAVARAGLSRAAARRAGRGRSPRDAAVVPLSAGGGRVLARRAAKLPWSKDDPGYAVGLFARDQGRSCRGG